MSTFGRVDGWNHGSSRGRRQSGGRFTRPSGGDRYRFTTEPRRKRDMVKEIKNRMREWGIEDPSWTDDPKHHAFWTSHVKWVRDAETGEGEASNEEQPADLPTMLSKDPVEAIREVLEQELFALVREEKDGLWKVTDSLFHENFPFKAPPYKFDKREGEYQLRSEYAKLGLGKDDFDPFKRFIYEKVPAELLLREQYVDDGNLSFAFRAIVAHTACHSAKCFHCHAETLQWNGYDSTVLFRFWKKLLCQNCGSVYEIKSAKDETRILEKFERWIDGGNYFDVFHSIQRELPRDAKQYIAIMAETPSMIDGSKVWPVLAAEIDYVVPQLKPNAFRNDNSHPKVYSRIFVKPRHDHLWFHTSHFEFDGQSIASQVIDCLPE